MKSHFLSLIYFISTICSAQSYLVSEIQPTLKENANAVIRNLKTEFRVKNKGEATTKVEGVYTILNENGDSHAILNLPFDKDFTKILNVEGRIVDEFGKKVRGLKFDDIMNIGSAAGSSSIEDDFIKVVDLSSNKYPYTVIFSYEIRTKNMMFYPTWGPYDTTNENLSVEKNEFTVIMPAELPLRYKEQNLPQAVIKTQENGTSVYKWKVENLPAFELEQNSPPIETITPMVLTAPSDFEIDDYKGTIKSWNDIGAFYWNLNKDRGKLSPEFVAKIKNLVKDIPNETEKIKKIYEFLQSNTRYVSIQLGIGGWQSLEAQHVSAKGFGDCKALTNYMMVMLREIGIKSNPVLVYAGRKIADITTDFPSFQFNHVFLSVPQKKDTLWIECTSQTNPLGYIGTFTSNRHALFIDENGSKMIQLPIYKTTDNQLIRNAFIKIDDAGEGVVDVNTYYSGLQQEAHSAAINQLGKEDQKKWLYNFINIPSLEIKNFSLEEKKGLIPVVNEKLTLQLKNVVTKSGTRFFITPNVFNQIKSIPVAKPNRKTDFEIKENFMDVDSIQFEIPWGFAAEYTPEPLNIQSKFGSYSTTMKIDGNKLIYIRKFSSLQGRYSSSIFSEYIDFRKKIAKADKNQVVLIKKT